jgi:bifunctional non-homologous end joining protein LigD
MSDTVTVDGREIEISHPDKLLYPDAGIPKHLVVDYYRRIAERMLPHVRSRPISMQRFPDGLGEEGFYQKEVPSYFPDWIDRVEVPKKEGGRVVQVTIESAATLVYLANQGCLTPHVWLSRKDRLDNPDRLIFDLDPPGKGEGEFRMVLEAARELVELLEGLGLRPFAMTTGSRGLHVTVPLDASEPFDEVRAFARRVAEHLAERHPKRFTTETRKADRGRRLFLDYLRNGYGQTGVAPYALRARAGAPVATPLSLNELDRGDLSSHSYRISNIFRRLAHKEDPWRDIDEHARGLDEARKQLKEL